MARLDQLTAPVRDSILAIPLPTFETTPWQPGPPLAERRVAIVTTAGLHRPGDRPYELHGGRAADFAGDYRIIPGGAGDGDGDGAPSTRDQLAAEIAFLRPWYEQSRQARGRTTVGVSGLTPEAAAELLADWIEGGDGSGVAPNRLKLAADDLRAYCLEAVAAQPGAGTNRVHLERWYWWETAVGRALRDAHPQAVASEDPAIRMLGKVLMIPVAQRPVT